MLSVSSLSIERAKTPIVQGVDFSVKPGEVLAIMGPNGSGKSTIALTLMGHPQCEVVAGDILLDGESLLALSPAERSARGLGMIFQIPRDISGVRYKDYLYQLHKISVAESLGIPVDALRRDKEARKKISLAAFTKELHALADAFGLSRLVFERDVHTGFSGGEKKKSEILQMCIRKPRYLIIDELDAGLDKDAFITCIQAIAERSSSMAIVLITHNEKCFEYLPATRKLVL